MKLTNQYFPFTGGRGIKKLLGPSKSAWTVRGHLEVSATVARQRNLLYILVRFIFEFPLICSSVDKICWERIVTNFYSMRVSFSHLKGLLACFGIYMGYVIMQMRFSIRKYYFLVGPRGRECSDTDI